MICLLVLGWTGDYQDPSTLSWIISNIKNGGSLQNFGFEPGQDNDKIKRARLGYLHQDAGEEANAQGNQRDAVALRKYAEEGSLVAR